MQLPQIDTPLLLDLLLGLVVLLFVPFGIRRGVAKEAIVSAAILLSATIAARWAEPWAAELTRLFAVDPAVARFAVTTGILIGGTLLLGYGGGAALGWTPVGLLARLMGGLLAAMNGALLLAYVLEALARDLAPGAALSSSLIGRELLGNLDLLLLGAAGVLLLCTVVGWIVTGVRRGRQPAAALNPALTGVPPRQRPVRVAREADAGKFEPEPARPAGGPNQALHETAPLPYRPDERGSAGGDGGAWWRPGNGKAPAERGNPGLTTGSEWSRQQRQRAGGERATDPSWRPWQDQGLGRSPEMAPSGSAEGGRRFGGTGPFDLPTDAERGRCPTCGAAVTPHDLFCPSCGKTL